MIVVSVYLPVDRDGGRSANIGEAELRDVVLVIEAAALQPSQLSAVMMRSLLNRRPVSRIRTSISPVSIRLRCAGAKPDGT